MTVGYAPIFNKSGGIIKDRELWSLYAAFTLASDTSALVKIGITTLPMQRLYAVHSGSPFPIKVAMWVDVGNASLVRKLEYAVHQAFSHRNTRGEWFRFDLTSTADKREFHLTMRELYKKHTHRNLVWKKTGLKQIVNFASETRATHRPEYRKMKGARVHRARMRELI